MTATSKNKDEDHNELADKNALHLDDSNPASDLSGFDTRFTTYASPRYIYIRVSYRIIKTLRTKERLLYSGNFDLLFYQI